MSMTTDTITSAKITDAALHRVLEHPDSLLVWLPLVDEVEVAERGLTYAQAQSPHIVPMFTSEEVQMYVTAQHGSRALAAHVLTMVLREELAR
jgi:hypothetical protein